MVANNFDKNAHCHATTMGVSYIYLHQNKINGKCYIGQTSQSLNERWECKERSYKGCIKFYNALLKYGWGNFIHSILKTCPTNEVDYWERL